MGKKLAVMAWEGGGYDSLEHFLLKSLFWTFQTILRYSYKKKKSFSRGFHYKLGAWLGLAC
jgi:hypothetical protein